MIKPERREAISELAEILGISRDLIFQAIRMLENKTAYRIWTGQDPKKPDKIRQFQKAIWPLNMIQTRIAVKIYPQSVTEISHGFVAGRTHRTAVLPHLQANTFFSFDIKDAFPSTRKKQVQLSFWQFATGFRRELADLMADLVCYTPTGKPEDAFLPLGYTSSPYVFNLVLKPTDWLLARFAQKKGYQVTRYVDNFAISSRSEIFADDRRDAKRLIESWNLGYFKIPEEKTSYKEVEKGRVHFEFLGLVIEGFRDGERKIGVADEKLGEYEWVLLGALEEKDFSERKFREIQGKIRYLKSVYRSQGRPIPARLFELYQHYLSMREIALAGKKGQVLFPI